MTLTTKNFMMRQLPMTQDGAIPTLFIHLTDLKSLSRPYVNLLKQELLGLMNSLHHLIHLLNQSVTTLFQIQ